MVVPAPSHPRRIAYLGTPEMAVPPLRALVDAGFEVPLVISRPDKRRGRRGEPTPSPVKAAAAELGIPVSDDVDDLLDTDVDLAVVVAFGRILKPHVLDVVPMVNLHFSLLPRWRGAAPVERAILAGDERTGVCVMVVEESLDTGGVYAQAEVVIRRASTAADLRAQLVAVGSRLLVDTLGTGLGEPAPQEGEVTYAEKLSTDDLRLDWTRPVEHLDRVVRVGGAWTTVRGQRLKVHAATPSRVPGTGAPGELHGDAVTTGSGALRLVDVQPEGKARMPFAAWANVAHLADGERHGDPVVVAD